jgi:hypothetical protein
MRPGLRFLLILMALFIAIFGLAAVDGAMVAGPGTRSALALVFGGSGQINHLSLPLLADPVGWVVLIVTLATPLFYSMQIEGIAAFVGMNERNLTHHAAARLQKADINRCVGNANERFERIGSRTGSAVILILTGVITATLYWQLTQSGILGSWNFTNATNDKWRGAVLAGWWANGHAHPVMAAVLIALGWYMFYFLAKQLLMGAVFAAWAKQVIAYGFGVTPNLRYNSDGYAGLRPLRRFMQWTYGSSLAHFLITLAVFAVWLPLTPITFFICIAIMITNAGVVIYPSTIAHAGALVTKTDYANDVEDDASLDADTKRKAVAEIWATNGLPFRLRATLTAVSLYVLAPLALAVVSATLGSK